MPVGGGDYFHQINQIVSVTSPMGGYSYAPYVNITSIQPVLNGPIQPWQPPFKHQEPTEEQKSAFRLAALLTTLPTPTEEEEQCYSPVDWAKEGF